MEVIVNWVTLETLKEFPGAPISSLALVKPPGKPSDTPKDDSLSPGFLEPPESSHSGNHFDKKPCIKSLSQGGVQVYGA